MSASDLVIAANASFAINESLFAKIPIFTFSYTFKEHLYFSDYGAHFILQEFQDVLRSIKGLETGFENFDCDGYGLRNDIQYVRDDENALRLDELQYRIESNMQTSKEVHSLNLGKSTFIHIE